MGQGAVAGVERYRNGGGGQQEEGYEEGEKEGVGMLGHFYIIGGK